MLKSSILWDITPRGPLKVYRRFRVKCRRPSYLFHAGFSLDLFFDREDGGDMFLRKVA
jgi:hypothetical protein